MGWGLLVTLLFVKKKSVIDELAKQFQEGEGGMVQKHPFHNQSYFNHIIISYSTYLINH